MGTYWAKKMLTVGGRMPTDEIIEETSIHGARSRSAQTLTDSLLATVETAPFRDLGTVVNSMRAIGELWGESKVLIINLRKI